MRSLNLFILFFLLQSACVTRAPLKNPQRFEQESPQIPAFTIDQKKLDPIALKLCDQGLSPSCLRLSEQIKEMINKENDPQKKEELYWGKYSFENRACLLNDPRGCYRASRWDLFLMKKIPERKSEALYLLEKSCQYQFPEACFEVGLWELQEGIKEESLAYFRQSCFLNYLPACLQGAKIAEELKYSQESFNMHNKACDLSDQNSCYNSGVLAFEAGNISLAKKIWEGSCQNKMASSCYNLSCLHFKENTSESVDQAFILLEKALQLGLLKSLIEFDDDLNPFRKDIRFIKLFYRYVK